MTIDHRIIYNEAKDYVGITLGLVLYAAAFTIFLLPYEIVTGGVTGMSAIIYYATGFKIENTYMIINLALLVVALKILGWKFLMKTIYAIFTLYFLLKFAQVLMPMDAAGHYVKILDRDRISCRCSSAVASQDRPWQSSSSTTGRRAEQTSLPPMSINIATCR